MKKIFVMTLMVMFLVNGIAVSAWAKPCMQGGTEVVKASADMPCHQNKEQKSTTKHCKGVCLCFHVSIHQTPILNFNDLRLAVIPVAADKILEENEVLESLSVSPPLRPPKYS